MKELMEKASQSIDNVVKSNVKQLENENNIIVLVYGILGIGILFLVKTAIDKGYSLTASFSKGKEVKISLDPNDKSNN